MWQQGIPGVKNVVWKKRMRSATHKNNSNNSNNNKTHAKKDRKAEKKKCAYK